MLRWLSALVGYDALGRRQARAFAGAAARFLAHIYAFLDLVLGFAHARFAL